MAATLFARWPEAGACFLISQTLTMNSITSTESPAVTQTAQAGAVNLSPLQLEDPALLEAAKLTRDAPSR